MSESNSRNMIVGLRMRCTPEESDQIKQNAMDAGMSVSEFLRTTALGRKTRSTVDSQMIAALIKMGGMLKDQFTKSGHQYADESAATLREITAAIARIDGNRK